VDIICAKCGKHLSGIESAREHHCKVSSSGIGVRWIPSRGKGKPRVSTEEWARIVSLIESAPPPQKKNADSSRAMNWLIFGIILFVIGLFVIVGLVR